MSEAALAGLKVLDLAWVVAGPMIGRVLADCGADVVRVESRRRIDTARMMGPFPGGKLDPQRGGLFDNCNAGKYGLALDLTKAEGRQVVQDLAAWADIVVESFAPGQMQRWGLGFEILRVNNPGLIMLSTSLSGQTGELSGLAGFGNVGAALSGYQSLVGWPDRNPVGPFGPYTDYVGPRFALLALLTALDQREHTKQGCRIDISQAEAGMQFLAPQFADYFATGRVALANGNRHHEMAPHAVFACREENTWVAIVARDDPDYARLAAHIGGAATAARFTDVTGRKADEDELESLIGAWCRTRNAADIERELQAIHVPAHLVASAEDMSADPQLAQRGHFIHLPHDLGGMSVVEASRFRLSETPAAPRRAAPHFGRDTDYVFRTILNYDDARIAALQAADALV